MRAKDKTLSRHYWFSSLSPFSYSLYPLATFSVKCIHESVYIGSRKTDLCPILCSFLIVINLIIQRFGFCIMSWLELNQAKPSPFWNSKQIFFSLKCLVIVNQKLFAFGRLCLMWVENPFSSTDIFVLLYNLLFLKQWTPVIKWTGNVRLSRNNSDYRDQSYWLIFQKFHPDTVMLTIENNQKQTVKKNPLFLKWGLCLFLNVN